MQALKFWTMAESLAHEVCNSTSTSFGRLKIKQPNSSLDLSVDFFFLEHAGELRIIVLIEEKRVIHRPKPTHTPTSTWKLNHRLKQKDDPTATAVL